MTLAGPNIETPNYHTVSATPGLTSLTSTEALRDRLAELVGDLRGVDRRASDALQRLLGPAPSEVAVDVPEPPEGTLGEIQGTLDALEEITRDLEASMTRLETV